MRDERPPRQGMQHLGQARMHALALARSKDHYIESGSHLEIIAQT
jgi:hypothetical protein